MVLFFIWLYSYTGIMEGGREEDGMLLGQHVINQWENSSKPFTFWLISMSMVLHFEEKNIERKKYVKKRKRGKRYHYYFGTANYKKNVSLLFACLSAVLTLKTHLGCWRDSVNVEFGYYNRNQGIKNTCNVILSKMLCPLFWPIWSRQLSLWIIPSTKFSVWNTHFLKAS